MLIILSSCGKKDDPGKEKSHELGKYLYLTDDNVLHTRRRCAGVFGASDEDGHEVNGMKFIRTKRFVSDPDMSYCKWCFDDDYYEKVQSISYQNIEDNINYSRRHNNDTVIDWEQYVVK